MNVCTTRRIHRRVAGDNGPPVEMTLRIDGVDDLASLNESTSEVVIWRRRGLTTTLAGSTITTIDADTNTVSIEIGTFLADVTWVGDWRIAVRAAFPGGDEWTSEWDVIRVGATA